MSKTGSIPFQVTSTVWQNTSSLQVNSGLVWPIHRSLSIAQLQEHFPKTKLLKDIVGLRTHHLMSAKTAH